MAGYKQKGDGDEDPVLLLFKAFFFPFCLWPFYSLRARAGLLCGCPQGRRRMLSASLLCGCPQGKAREEEPEQAAYGNGERDKK